MSKSNTLTIIHVRKLLHQGNATNTCHQSHSDIMDLSCIVLFDVYTNLLSISRTAEFRQKTYYHIFI